MLPGVVGKTRRFLSPPAPPPPPRVVDVLEHPPPPPPPPPPSTNTSVIPAGTLQVDDDANCADFKTLLLLEVKFEKAEGIVFS